MVVKTIFLDSYLQMNQKLKIPKTSHSQTPYTFSVITDDIMFCENQDIYTVGLSGLLQAFCELTHFPSLQHICGCVRQCAVWLLCVFNYCIYSTLHGMC